MTPEQSSPVLEGSIDSNSQLASELEAISRNMEVRPDAPLDEQKKAEAPTTEPLKIHLVNEQALVDARVHQMAEQNLQERLGKHHGLRGLPAKIWQGNMGRDYFLMREASKAKAAVRKDNTLVLGKDVSREDLSHQLKMDVERFHSEFDLIDLIDQAEGEKSTKLQSTPEGKAASAAIKDLVRKSVDENMPPEAFAEERTRVLNSLSDRGIIDKADLYADNLMLIADQVKARIASGENLDKILENTQIYLDTSKMGVRTETHFSGVEKLHAKMMKVPLVNLINEATVVASVSALYSIGKWSTQRTTSAAMRVGGIGLGAGAFAAFRENSRLKVERSVDMRERAEGATFAEGSKRREKFEESAYDMKPASELYTSIKNLLVTESKDGSFEGRAMEKDDYQALMVQVAEIDARRNSGRTGIDLISYSSAANVAKERRDLYMVAAIAKVQLGRLAAEHPDWVPPVAPAPAAEAKHQFSQESWRKAFRPSTEVEPAKPVAHHEAALKALTETFRTQNKAEVGANDALYRKFARREVAKKAAATALIGISAGIISQNIVSMARDGQNGLMDGVRRDTMESHRPSGLGTKAHELRSYLSSHKAEAISPEHKVPLGNGNVLKVPNGIHTVREANGSYNVVRGRDVLAKDLHFGPHGTLDKASLHRLHEAGIKTHEHTVATHHEVEHSGPTSDQEFVKRHLHEMKRVHREGWYDNNTSGVADKNELRMHWGGTGGMDAKGDYVFTTAAMTPGGSYHDGLSANAGALAREGKLQILLSVSRGTEHHVFAVPVDAHGNAVIAAHSTAGRVLFEHHDGVAEFKGAYAEVAQVTGTNPDGSERVRMLSTDLGKGLPTVHDTFTTDKVSFHTTTTLDVPTPKEVPIIPRVVPVPTSGSDTVFVPPVLPILYRNGLERAEQPPAEEPAGFVPGPRSSEDIAALTSAPTQQELERGREQSQPEIPSAPSETPSQPLPAGQSASRPALDAAPTRPELDAAPTRRELEGPNASGEVVPLTERELREYTPVTEIGPDGQPITVYRTPDLDNLRPARTPTFDGRVIDGEVMQTNSAGETVRVPAADATRPERRVIQADQTGSAEVVPANVARAPRRAADLHGRAPRPARLNQGAYSGQVQAALSATPAPTRPVTARQRPVAEPTAAPAAAESTPAPRTNATAATRPSSQPRPAAPVTSVEKAPAASTKRARRTTSAQREAVQTYRRMTTLINSIAAKGSGQNGDLVSWKEDIAALTPEEQTAFVNAGIATGWWSEKIVERNTRTGKHKTLQLVPSVDSKLGTQLFKAVMKQKGVQSLDNREYEVTTLADELVNVKTFADLKRFRERMINTGVVGFKPGAEGTLAYDVFPRRYRGMADLFGRYMERQDQLLDASPRVKRAAARGKVSLEKPQTT